MKKRHLKLFKEFIFYSVWVNPAFEQITKDTLKHCFKKCGLSEVSLLAEELDKEFENLLKCLTIDEYVYAYAYEYASFDDDANQCATERLGRYPTQALHRKC